MICPDPTVSMIFVFVVALLAGIALGDAMKPRLRPERTGDEPFRGGFVAGAPWVGTLLALGAIAGIVLAMVIGLVR